MAVPLDPTTEAGVFEAARQVLAVPTAPAFTLDAVAERAGVDPERLRHRWPDAAMLLAEAVGRGGAIEDVPDLGDTRAELSVALHRLFDAYYRNTFAERAVPKLAVVVSAGVARDFTPRFDETRDFTPLIDDNRTRLGAGVSVVADGLGILPPSLRADRIVVLHGDEAWVAPLEERPRGIRSSRQITAGARLGPKWEPNTLVDIVVRLVGAGGAARLVRVPRQRIVHVA